MANLASAGFASLQKGLKPLEKPPLARDARAVTLTSCAVGGKLPLRLYPKSHTADLDPRLFRNPSAHYRGTPFWAWNDKLHIPRLLRQIDQLQRMGFGGFLIHSRTGLDTEYLGRAYMAAVKACVKRAADKGMLAWLYDEDRWPSGFGGGLVTCDKRYRIKHLLWTQRPYGPTPPPRVLSDYTAATRSEDGVLLAKYAVVLHQGCLKEYRRLAASEPAPRGASIWHAYLESPMESTWFNGQTHVDSLSRKAIERFLAVTHERFAAALPGAIGGRCPGFFTDEPQFTKKSQFAHGDEVRDLFMPFTTDFADTYRAAYDDELLDHLPELFWNLPRGRASATRYRYHDHVAERFASAFGDTISNWCGRHRATLTGHMLAEPQLHSQTRGGGEVMRVMRGFQLPGIDMLSDKMELTTAKQAASLAHQFGREGVASELYGVTNWDFDFVGHKAQGDWQAALGVTLRIPHHAWYSMRGEAKRDYPASIAHQSPWFEEYPLIEDHFARLATVLTRGKPLVRIGVIHPIESSWLNWGPVDSNRRAVAEQEEAFTNLAWWLCFGLLDFDYISEALLPTQCPKQRGRQLRVGEMRYDAVIVPGLKTIRSTTLERLEHFAAAGGMVIFAGDVPALVDAVPNRLAIKLAGNCVRVPLARDAILAALEPCRMIGVRQSNGQPADSILHQIRVEGDRRHLFLCNTDRATGRADATIRITGHWQATQFDTLTGESAPLGTTIDAGSTEIRHSFPAHGHLLLTLRPATRSIARPITTKRWVEHAHLTDPVPVTLSEPNVLLLDQAEWRIDGGSWQPTEEILRIDNEVRRRLNLPGRTGKEIQPWADRSPAPVLATVELKFTINADTATKKLKLATESVEGLQLRLNGRALRMKTDGWWTDEAIQTLKLGSLPSGKHELILRIPFTRMTGLEWCYLLGDFGVNVAGRHATLTKPVRKLAFGDWTHQGLPFYGGNVTYRCKFNALTAPTLLEVLQFKNPLLSVSARGRTLGKIAFAPFQLELSRSPGKRSLDITAFGNRINCFGALHHTDLNSKWVGPGAWRSTGASWSYEYQLRPMGILAAPILKTLSPRTPP